MVGLAKEGRGKNVPYAANYDKHRICCQGRPTEAMAEVDPLVYGGQVAKDFIPGAEALPEEAESAEGEKEENGERERE